MKRNGEEMNRTGASLNPEATAELVGVTQSTPPSSTGDGRIIAAVRTEYSRAGALLGHLPRSEGAARGKKAGLRGTLLDKMGERLAFERAGVRLYEALLAKLDAPVPIGPSSPPPREDLERICREEHEHFVMMNEAITAMGGDPTAMTPAANVTATASQGLAKVLLDPRSTFAQCLDAMLIAELTDNDGWTLLIELAEANGEDDLVARFREAQDHEIEHLELVRGWIRESALTGEPAKALA